ncbi:uncharacterized protein [Argopecten irradians]|uniref:uncharacterized protein n=1 Tax=Argopecten irradians TaxID=31199 RepID=UPI00372484CE
MNMPVFTVTTVCLVLITTVSAVEIIDKEKILEEYVSVCGMMLCDTSILNIKPERIYTPHSSCPDCRCDSDCWLKRNCCPDVYLTFPDLLEVKTNIFTAMNGTSQDIYQRMVSSCPNKDTSCDVGPRLADHFSNVPVFAGPFSLPFRSACFAHCNGHDVTRDWYLDIKCEHFYDLNYCSTFEEIESTLHTANCTVTYTQDLMTSYKPTTEAVISECNVTGFWDTYNVDVDNLCAKTHVGPEMGRHSLTHSNIFCYMCNPSEVRNRDVISTCNVTGKWRVLDQGLRDACHHYRVSPSEQPYKNWFCRMCNHDDSDPSILDLTDGTIKLTYKTVADWNFNPAQQYDVTLQTMDLDFIVESLKQQGKINASNTVVKSRLEQVLSNDGEIDINGVTVNVTNLLYNMYLSTGSYDVCTSSLLNVTYTETPVNCSCNVMCVFSDTDICCPDVALLRTKCIEPFGISDIFSKRDATKLLVINDCPSEFSNDVIRYLCQSNDVISNNQLIPVESRTSRLVFRNLFCAVCHLNKNMSDPFDVFLTKIQFYTLRLVCLLPVPIQNEISVDRIVSRAVDSGCTVQYIPATVPYTCDAHRGQCNKVNLWTEDDRDVRWACENIDFFPRLQSSANIFCNICNPMSPFPAVFRTCNMTGQWRNREPGLDTACRSYPVLQQTSPYKNGLCQRCNDPTWTRSFTGNAMAVGTVNVFPSLVTHTAPRRTIRSFFTTYNEQTEEYEDDSSGRCQHHQIHDVWKNKCRDLRCSPGRHLYNLTCLPLLRRTTNLAYALSLSVYGRINHSNIILTDLMEAMPNLVHRHLSGRLNVSYGNFTMSSFLTLSDTPCPNRSSVIFLGADIEIMFSAHFEIRSEYVNRFETERRLIELPGQTMDVSFLKKTISFTISENPKALTLPILIGKAGLENQCYYRKTKGSLSGPHMAYRRSEVSELLQCRQVHLNVDEYLIDENGITMNFVGIDKVVKYPEFELMSNGRVRICEGKLPTRNLENITDDQMETALYIVTLVLKCVSMLCLLLALIPYLRFDYLRTLPGLNTVVLMMTLFLVQLTFIGQTFTSTHNKPACTALGILMHLIWLLYFAWTAVGTLHAYRLFVSDDFFTDDDNRYRDLGRYFRSAIIFSLSVVIVNICLTAAITGGASIGYGGDSCFITYLTGKVLAFIVPVILVCVWNAVFFGITYWYIRKETLKCRQLIKGKAANKDSFFNLELFFKLFFLSGLTWILQIIDGFLPVSPFSFIVTIINASQGCLILYLNRTNFKKRKHRRRPGSKYTGSTSRSQPSYSSSKNRMSSRTVSETYHNSGFDRDVVAENIARSLSATPSDVSVTSTSKIIRKADDCHSNSENRSDCDSIADDLTIGHSTEEGSDYGNIQTDERLENMDSEKIEGLQIVNNEKDGKSEYIKSEKDWVCESDDCHYRYNIDDKINSDCICDEKDISASFV